MGPAKRKHGDIGSYDSIANRRVTRSMSVPNHHRAAPILSSNASIVKPQTPKTPDTQASKSRRKSTGKNSPFHIPSRVSQSQAGKSPVKSKSRCTPASPVRQRAPISAKRFGLIQEEIAHDLYALVVQAILWNQTAGKQARPVLQQLLETYPDPAALAAAEFDDVAGMLHPIGLYNNRAKRLLDMARTWLEKPPVGGRGYAKARDRKYAAVPLPLAEIKTEGGCEGEREPELSEEVADSNLSTSAGFWEIAHLPGVGPYALDSFRIFHRDEMRGLAGSWLGAGASDSNFEPEWRRVVPADKELRAYLKWLWEKDGWDWDWETGKRKLIPTGMERETDV